MKIAVLGTGVVGQTLAGRLSELGNDVAVGTRDVLATMARDERQSTGTPPFPVWHQAHPAVSVATLSEAASYGEIVILAVPGLVAVEALEAAGPASLSGKIVIDVSNPLDFTGGFPPRLGVCNDDSVAEQLQRTARDARIVKALNTVSAAVMIAPEQVAGGDHDLFMCGNDEAAKAEVSRLLAQWFGWRRIIDLGDIAQARGIEMYLALWVRLFGVLGTPLFNAKVAR